MYYIQVYIKIHVEDIFHQYKLIQCGTGLLVRSYRSKRTCVQIHYWKHSTNCYKFSTYYLSPGYRGLKPSMFINLYRHPVTSMDFIELINFLSSSIWLANNAASDAQEWWKSRDLSFSSPSNSSLVKCSFPRFFKWPIL